ncbi:MAG: hypothetical protein ACRELY_20885 [Polyangiaceae bacterium]
MSERRLLVRADGELMPDADARAFWKRFSDHMERNHGDLAGFAKSEGFASVRPAVENGAAVLIASHSDAQVPYENVSSGSADSGQGARQRSIAGSGGSQSRARNPAKKR